MLERMKIPLTQSSKTEREPPERNQPPDSPESARASRLDRIARRAYQIHETRGGGSERSLSDWLEAEREIDLTD
jgi:hypothetical protein